MVLLRKGVLFREMDGEGSRVWCFLEKGDFDGEEKCWLNCIEFYIGRENFSN